MLKSTSLNSSPRHAKISAEPADLVSYDKLKLPSWSHKILIFVHCQFRDKSSIFFAFSYVTYVSEIPELATDEIQKLMGTYLMGPRWQ